MKKTENYKITVSQKSATVFDCWKLNLHLRLQFKHFNVHLHFQNGSFRLTKYKPFIVPNIIN